MAEPVCAHCGTGLHPEPSWRRLLSRASLDLYYTTDTVTSAALGDVWLHASCIAEYMREHPALALSIPT